MNKPRKQPNQYTVKRDRPAAKSARDKEPEPAAEKAPLPNIAELTKKRDDLTATLARIEGEVRRCSCFTQHKDRQATAWNLSHVCMSFGDRIWQTAARSVCLLAHRSWRLRTAT